MHVIKVVENYFEIVQTSIKNVIKYTNKKDISNNIESYEKKDRERSKITLNKIIEHDFLINNLLKKFNY